MFYKYYLCHILKCPVIWSNSWVTLLPPYYTPLSRVYKCRISLSLHMGSLILPCWKIISNNWLINLTLATSYGICFYTKMSRGSTTVNFLSRRLFGWLFSGRIRLPSWTVSSIQQHVLLFNITHKVTSWGLSSLYM